MKLLIISMLAAVSYAADKCVPYEMTSSTIPNSRIVKGKVERCMPEGEWKVEKGEHLFTLADLAAAANSGYEQGQNQCVELVEAALDERLKKLSK